jgi:transposase-like protein
MRIIRVGKLELRVPRDRDGWFSTELFDRYQGSDRALVIIEIHCQGCEGRANRTVAALDDQKFGISDGISGEVEVDYRNSD